MLLGKLSKMHDFILREFHGNNFASIIASLKFKESTLTASWIITGQVSEIILPPIKLEPKRQDKLWENTCFEIFLKQENQENYYEYNFSPNLSWNSYCFKSYRSEIASFETDTPLIQFKSSAESLIMSAKITLPQELRYKTQLALAIATVLKTRQGLTYWALNHPKEKPDFHSQFETLKLQ